MSVDRREEEEKEYKKDKKKTKVCIIFNEFMQRQGLFSHFWVHVLTDYI